jgi:hypothetical protein
VAFIAYLHVVGRQAALGLTQVKALVAAQHDADVDALTLVP